MDKDIERALSKSKIGIITTGTHFLSSITFSMQHVMDESINTADVDGKIVRYNPNFFMKLPPTGRIFVMAHESWHVALNHLGRTGTKDHELYGKAADYVINLILVTAGFIMPKVTIEMLKNAPPGSDIKEGDNLGLLNYRFEGMSTDEVYEILKKEDPPKPTMMDGDLRPASSPEEAKEIQESIKQNIVKAIARSKLSGTDEPGSIPGEIQRLIHKLLNPKLPWETLLRRFLIEVVKNDYTWKRPNKRFFPDFILPSQHSNSLGHLALVIDTSMSFTDKQATAALSEIRYIHRLFKPSKLTVMTCDARIHDIYEIGPNDRVDDLKFNGGGGTRFEPVFKHFEKKPPQALIYFTDLYANPITKQPKYPVIWICSSQHTPALIGRTIYLKD